MAIYAVNCTRAVRCSRKTKGSSKLMPLFAVDPGPLERAEKHVNTSVPKFSLTRSAPSDHVRNAHIAPEL
jgi:hypothetical protein